VKQSGNRRTQSSSLARSKPYDSEAALSDEESGDNIQNKHCNINGQSNKHSSSNNNGGNSSSGANHHRNGSNSNSGTGSGIPDRDSMHHHQQVRGVRMNTIVM
jgi:hypothetical protein